MRAGILLLAVCGLITAQEKPPLDRARELTQGLAQEIRALLMGELKKGGLDSAVSACARLAQPATRAYGKRNAVEIRRISERYRNPDDRPDEAEQRVLNEWAKRAAAGLPVEEHSWVEVEGGRRVLRFLRPIRVEPMCLSCHGPEESLPQEVRVVLKQNYPADLATGYRAGDLRGAFSLRLLLPEN